MQYLKVMSLMSFVDYSYITNGKGKKFDICIQTLTS